MITLPKAAVLVRTWFGDDRAWEHLVSEVETPSEEGFLADVRFVDDAGFDGLTAQGLMAEQPEGPAVSFIADQITLTQADHPILAVSVLPRHTDDEPEQPPFRVVPSELWSVENNINLANMDWVEFAGSAGADGVFRGF